MVLVSVSVYYLHFEGFTEALPPLLNLLHLPILLSTHQVFMAKIRVALEHVCDLPLQARTFISIPEEVVYKYKGKGVRLRFFTILLNTYSFQIELYIVYFVYLVLPKQYHIIRVL